MDGDGLEQGGARAGGCTCSSSRRFAVGAREQASFVRLAISSPRDAAQLGEGLRILRDLIEDGGGQAAPLLV